MARARRSPGDLRCSNLAIGVVSLLALAGCLPSCSCCHLSHEAPTHARARTHLTGTAGPLALALEALETSRRALDLEVAQAKQLTAAALAQKEEAERQLRELEERGRREAEEARNKLLHDLESAQVQVSALVAELQVVPTLAKAAEVQGALRQQETTQRKELALLHAEPEDPQERGDAITVGGRVRISRLDREGEVLEIKGTDALVQAGALRIRQPLEDLVPLRGKAANAPRLKQPGAPLARAQGASAQALASAAERCDVRGLRADEALRMAEAVLDRLDGEGRPLAYIVHGHGTGALKQSLRDYLGSSPYVKAWRPAENAEGGDGATRIDLGG